MSELSGDLSHEIPKLVLGSDSPGAFGCAEFSGGGVLMGDDPHDERIRTIRLSGVSGPLDGIVCRFGTVHARHDTSNGAVLRMLSIT